MDIGVENSDRSTTIGFETAVLKEFKSNVINNVKTIIAVQNMDHVKPSNTLEQVLEKLDKLKNSAREDCYGSLMDSLRFQVKFNSVLHPKSKNYVTEPQPFFQSACTSQETCTLDPFRRNTKSLCLDDRIGGFCSFCDFGKCRKVGQPTLCTMRIREDDDTNTVCLAFNGTLNFNNRCVFPARRTLALCERNMGQERLQFPTHSYCYNSLETKKRSCKGKWSNDLDQCIYPYSFRRCTDFKFTFVPIFEFREGTLDTKSECEKTGRVCFLNNGTYVNNVDICSNEIVVREGYCEDFEYYNVNDGLCTYVPTTIDDLECIHRTATGLCIHKGVTRENCAGQWQDRSFTKSSCLEKGQYCVTRDGQKTLLNSKDCKACHGSPTWAYKWREPLLRKGSEMKKLEWTKVDWVKRNEIRKNFLSVNELREVLKTSASRVLGAKLMGEYKPYLNTLMSAFSGIACDCLEQLDNCFEMGIKTDMSTCNYDATKNGNCVGLYVKPETFSGGEVVTIKGVKVSAANYFASESVISRREDNGILS